MLGHEESVRVVKAQQDPRDGGGGGGGIGGGWNWRDDRGDKVPERDPARVAYLYLYFHGMGPDRDSLAGTILRLEGRPEPGALVHGFRPGIAGSGNENGHCRCCCSSSSSSNSGGSGSMVLRMTKAAIASASGGRTTFFAVRALSNMAGIPCLFRQAGSHRPLIPPAPAILHGMPHEEC